ncbi:MAG: zinc protease [Glaciecola sp.]
MLLACETAKNTPAETSQTQVDLGIAAKLKASTSLPIDENIVKGQLSNGLRYIIRENATPENFAELRLVVKTGSIFEDDSQRGFAHFAEHMAFNGTQDFKEQEIIEFVESIGMRFGAHLNATTTFDNTIYKLRVPSDNPQVIEKAMHILENWAHKVTFDATAIDEERGVVLEEWRSRKGVGERIAKQQWPVMFAGTNYASRLPIGTEEIITSGKHEDLIRFYNTWYRPDLMSVVAVGDFDSSTIQTLIEKYFGKIERPETPVTIPTQYLEVYDTPVINIFSDAELTGITLSSSWRNKTQTGEYTQQQYKKRVIKNVLSGVLTKRINDLALETTSPFVGARIGANQTIPTAEEFFFRASVKPNQTAAAFARLLTEVKRVVDHGISEQELATEKRLYLEWFESAIKSQNTLQHGAYLGSYVNHFLNGSPITSLAQDFTLSKMFISEITLADIQAQMKTWAGHQNAVVFLNAPSNMEDQLPSEAELGNIWQQVQSTPTQVLEDKKQVSALMNELPMPGTVLNKTYIEKWDAHQWLLSNGVKVILKSTTFTENAIQFKAISDGGYALVDDQTYLTSFGLMDSLNFMGLGSLDMEQLAQFSREKRFSVNPSIDTYTESMAGGSNNQDLIYMMQSIYLRFTAPVKDHKRFDWLKDSYRPRLKNKYNSPNAQFYAAIQAKTQLGNPRNVEFDVAMLNKQNLDTIYAVYQQRFANPSDFTFVFVGDIDLDKMDTYLSTYIASLPTTNSKETRVKLPNYALQGDYQIHMEKGTEPKATVIISLFGEGIWSYQNQMVMSAFKNALEKALRDRLREELAGVYSVSVSARLSRWPYQNYSVNISFTCDPQRVDELYGEVNAVFAQFIAGDIDEQQIDNFKIQAKTGRDKNLKENGFWLNYMLNHYTPYTPLPIADYNALVDSVTLAGVKQAAKQYLVTDNRLYATLKPEPSVDIQIAEPVN